MSIYVDFTKITSTCRKFLILQNGLQVNDILNFFYFQVNGALKNTCVLSNYACYNHIIHKIFNVKVDFEH
jgi:hypothetical protein